MAFCHGVLPWKMRICRGRAGTHAKHREVVSCADSGRTDAAGLQGSPGDSKNWKDFASYGEAIFDVEAYPISGDGKARRQRRRAPMREPAAEVRGVGFQAVRLSSHVLVLKFPACNRSQPSSCAFKSPFFSIAVTQRLNSIEVSTSLCGSDNPGSIPG